MKKYKILYIAHCADLDGSGRALLHILDGLKDAVEPVVLLPKRGRLLDVLREKGIQTVVSHYSIDTSAPLHSVKDLCLWLPRQVRTYVFRFFAKRQAIRLVRQEKVDLVHTNSSVIHWGADVAEVCGCPHVWHVRECQDVGLQLRPIGGMEGLCRLMGAPNNHCVAITRFVSEHHQLQADKDVVIYDGVFSAAQLAVPVTPVPGKYFLYVGTLSVSKGFFDSVAAFESLAESEPDVELWMVGEKNAAAVHAVEVSPVRDRIRLLGFRKDVYTLMRQARATLVPTFFEGFGFVAAEAMLNECLVIGRDTAGTKEQFDNGLRMYGAEIGRRFRTVEELTEQMLWVCRADRTEVAPYLQRGKAIVAQYTIERSCAALLEYYQRILRA